MNRGAYAAYAPRSPAECRRLVVQIHPYVQELRPERFLVEGEDRPRRAGSLDGAEADVRRDQGGVQGMVELPTGPHDLVPVEERITCHELQVGGEIDPDREAEFRKET